MVSGGARSRSGPPPDPTSGRSDRRSLEQRRIPRVPFAGPVPSLKDFYPSAPARVGEIWSQLWSTPQAHVWAIEPWRWPVVADLAKYTARTEPADAPGWLAPAIMRLRDECLLSADGMTRQGWTWAADEVAAKGAEKAAATPVQKSSRDRLKAVSSGGD